MAQLKQFIDKFQIDLDALKRIKKRVFVVGRFNQRSTEGEPDIYLFTNRGDLNDKYVKNFSRVFDMRYDSFVQALRPAIAERVDRSGRFPIVEQQVPQGDDALEGTSVIDVFNYFFQRAVANSEQEAFQTTQPGLPKELLQKSEQERGKAILRQIRTSLETFCTFQPRAHGVVEAFARYVGQLGREHGLPAYAAGGPLPGGMPERLLDFLYAEDVRALFDPEGLDFSGLWGPMAKDEAAKKMFAYVVSAFRDSILSIPAQQYMQIRFRGNQPLSKIAEDAVTQEVRSEFQAAREAFNGLRQILRSKVLLSMVLEWLMSAYDEVKDVQAVAPGNDYARHRAVEHAILDNWRENGLAKPVPRASIEERRRFSKLLTDRFQDVLKAIVAPAAEYTDLVAGLPDPLLELIESLRADEEKRRLLTVVAGVEQGDEMHNAFLDAARTVLLDVLCPTLYRTPVVTVRDLKRLFRQESMAAYLTAVFLGDSAQDAVHKIAEDHLEFFESKIDEATKTIRDENDILQRLLGDFLDVLAQPEIQRRLAEGVRVLEEVHALLEQTSLEKERQGGGGMGSTRPHEVVEGTLKETPVDGEIIRILAHDRTHAKLEQRMAAAQVASVATEEPDSGSDAVPSTSAGEQPSEVEDEVGEAPVHQTRLDRKIEEILEKALPKSSEELAQLTSKDQEGLERQVSEEVLHDETFVGGLAEDLMAFERTLHLVYTRYVENPDKRTFRNKVERMTLTNMMLLFQEELGLGRVSSNLYQLLLDLVLHLDPEDPDPWDFMREKSLTLYFDNSKLAEGGIMDLRQTLDIQGARSLNNIKSFVSELRGVKYLMDMVSSDRDAEVVVVNATAEEFLNWLHDDNLTEGRGKGLLRSGGLVRTGEQSQDAIPPGLVYMTDIAFPGGSDRGAKEAWVQALAERSMRERGLSYLIPPICLSTGPLEADWEKSGESCAEAATQAPAPIVIMGPSPRLNPENDGFATVLPAGYVFAAHLLHAPHQRLRINSVARQSSGRFRVVGYGTAEMRQSLDRALWGEGPEDTYAFAADFYLYVVLTLLATAKRYGGTQSLDEQEFFRCFWYSDEEVVGKDAYRSSELLDDALLGGHALAFALDQDPSQTELSSLTFVPSRESLLDAQVKRRRMTQVQWFQRALRQTGLH